MKPPRPPLPVLLAAGALSVAGLAAAAAPAVVTVDSEGLDAMFLFTPMAGAFAFAFLMVGLFGRGRWSGAALAAFGLPLYGAAVLFAISRAMQAG